MKRVNPSNVQVAQTTFWDTEWRVNAAWNSVFQRMFNDHNSRPVTSLAVGPWLIGPEAYPNDDSTRGFMADLAIFHSSAMTKPRILYEGKGGSSNKTMENVYDQLKTWLEACTTITPDSPVWVIGAIGEKMKVWLYERSAPNVSTMKPVYVTSVISASGVQIGEVESVSKNSLALYRYNFGSLEAFCIFRYIQEKILVPQQPVCSVVGSIEIIDLT